MAVPPDGDAPAGAGFEALGLSALDVLESVTDAFFFLDREWRFAYLNRQAEAVLGISRATAVGGTIWEMFPASVGSEFEFQYRLAVKAGQRASFVAYFPPLQAWFDVTAYPSEKGLAVYFRDVTESRQAEETLRATTDAVPALLAYLDRDLVYRFCNLAYEEFLGMPRADVVGRPVRDVVGESVFATAQPFFERALAGEEVTFATWMAYPRVGRKYVRVNYRPRLDDAGEVLGVYTLVVDETELKLAEDRHAESEARYRATLDALPALVFHIDADLRYRFANRRFEEWFGKPRESAVGRPVREEVGEATFAFILPYLGRALAGEGAEWESWVDFPQGRRYVRTVYVPTRTADGRVTGIDVLATDVTQARLAEEALRESSERLRLMVESVPEIAWTARPDGVIDHYNERWYEYTGPRRGETGDESWTPLLHPDDREATYAAWRRSVETGEPYEVELRLRNAATGEHRWFLARARPLRGPDGEIVRWFGITSDIHEQKRTQHALAVANRLGATLGEDLDPERIVQALTDASTEAVGAEFGSFFYAKPDLEPGPDGGERYGLYVLSGAPKEAFASFPPVRTTPLFAPTFRGEGSVRLDDVALDPRFSGMPTGHLPVRSYLAMTVHGRDGNVLGGLLFGHPEPGRFTPEHQRLVESFAAQASVAYENALLYGRLRDANEGLERRVDERTQELVRANRDLNEFSYSVAHDLRAPLRAIVSTSRILMEDAQERLTEDERGLLERQATSAVRLAKIVDDLLGFARLANAEPKRAEFDLSLLARETAREVARRREGCAVVVQDGLRAVADRSLVGYVLTNLLDNACKFSPNGGTVTVGEEDGAFFVRDQGMGFDMAHAHKLFTAFERLMGLEIEGTGVGLANVKRIVEKHGGRIWAESEPGKGATFWFTLG